MRGLQLAAPLLVAALVLGHARAGAEVRVFVTNEKSDNVTVIDAATRKVIQTIPVGKRPRGVAVSPDGRRVYVTNSNSDTLSVIDARSLAVLSTVPAAVEARSTWPSRWTAPARTCLTASPGTFASSTPYRCGCSRRSRWGLGPGGRRSRRMAGSSGRRSGGPTRSR